MNAAHVHLLLNHLPVVGTVGGLLFLAAAMVRHSEELLRASAVVFVASALLAVPTYLTGEPAEEIVEHLPGVSKAIIESHEEAAEAAAVGVGVLGAIALAGLVLARRSARLPKWLTPALVIGALVAGGLLARAANLGGQIRHSEIRSEQGGPPPALERSSAPGE